MLLSPLSFLSFPPLPSIFTLFPPLFPLLKVKYNTRTVIPMTIVSIEIAIQIHPPFCIFVFLFAPVFVVCLKCFLQWRTYKSQICLSVMSVCMSVVSTFSVWNDVIGCDRIQWDSVMRHYMTVSVNVCTGAHDNDCAVHDSVWQLQWHVTMLHWEDCSVHMIVIV